MYDQYVHWHEVLVNFAKQIGKPDPVTYINDGGWKARQGGNGLAAAQHIWYFVSWHWTFPSATDKVLAFAICISLMCRKFF